uniref:Thrombomodulin n=1 Tax=Lates calcarifer TaxID=8187 RepID=A0A4W6D0M9_LATCA
MIPTTRALLICAAFLCGLKEVVLSQHGHCAGNLCFVLLQKPEDFPGAQKNCKEVGGQLLKISSEQAQKTLPTPLNRMSGSYWLALHDSAGGTTGEVSARLHNCSSISVTNEGKLSCTCKDGFVEDDGVCVNNAICEKCEHMLCKKRNGAYRCECREGFSVSAADPTKCNVHCAERDCPADCVYDPDVERIDLQKCYCPDGYIRHNGNDTALCTDINECEMGPQCDHMCENLFGSYRCICHEGFELHQNRCVRVATMDWEEGSDIPTTPSIPPPDPTRQPSGVTVGGLVGIIVCTVFFIVLIVFLAHHFLNRKRRTVSKRQLKQGHVNVQINRTAETVLDLL